MRPLLFIAIGGALGALSRYWLANFINDLVSTRLHVGTLVVNIVGSFLIGVIYVLIVEKLFLHPEWRNVLIVGFLGAFTTFSTFSLESINYLENGYAGMAALYILLSVLLCLVASGAGIWITRSF